MCVHTAELPVSTDSQTDGRTDRQTDKLIWGGLGNLSGEEVSVSLGYALRTTDRLTAGRTTYGVDGRLNKEILGTLLVCP